MKKKHVNQSTRAGYNGHLENMCVCVNEKEICKPKYKGRIQRALSGRFTKEKQKTTLSQHDPSQSTKSIKGIKPSFMYILTQANILLRNNHFNLFSDCSSFPNTIWFLSCHKVQKMHSGAACQAFLSFLLTKES